MLDLQELRVSFRQYLGVDSDDFPDSTIFPDGITEKTGKTGANVVLNEAYWELLDKFHFREKEVTATFSTEVGLYNYKVPSPFEALRQLSIEEEETGKHTPLIRETLFGREKLYENHEDSRGFPTHYVREKDGILVRPTPDDVYVITISYWTTLEDLEQASDEPEIPRAWHELIKLGAAWRGALILGDHAKASSFKAHFVSQINTLTPVEEKEEGDTHEEGVEVKGYSDEDL